MKKIRLIILFSILYICSTGILFAQTDEISKVKTDIAKLLESRVAIFGPEIDANNILTYWGETGNTLVLEDRIEFKKKDRKTLIIYFAEITDISIITQLTIEKNLRVLLAYNGSAYNIVICLGNKSHAKQFYDDLILIQKLQIEERSAKLVPFKLIAEQYCALKVKPAVTEEQRKYIVQANGFAEQKSYPKAIECYKKAIEINETAYPAAYSNIALLCAQVNYFHAAIYYMKKYLMLVPDAEDARGAQDKIYMWEGQTGSK
jgi:tetratricopeptide (TPR) repeat protein